MSANAYLRLLRRPGAVRLSGAFLALGTANTMAPVAFILFAHAALHSYGYASLVLAANTAGSMIFGPLRGRLVDRIGARRAVLLLAVPDVITDFGFIAAGLAHVTPWALIAIAFAADAITAPASTSLRAVWSRTLPETERKAGFALLSMLQETFFIAGPALAGILVAVGSPTAAVATAAVLSLAGALAFAVPHIDEPAATATRPTTRIPALAGGGIRTVVTTAGLFGVTFGALDVAFPTFARTHGSAATAGILLSAFAVGSWIGTLGYGLRPQRHTAGERYPRLCLLAAVGLAPLILMPGVAFMAALAILSGICFAPISISQMAVIDEVAESGHRNEAFSWLSTFYGAGSAAGAAIAGQVIVATGTRAALLAALVATSSAWLLTTLRSRTLRTAGATPPPISVAVD